MCANGLSGCRFPLESSYGKRGGVFGSSLLHELYRLQQEAGGHMLLKDDSIRKLASKPSTGLNACSLPN